MRRFHWLALVLLALAWGVVVGTVMGDRNEKLPDKGTLSAWAREAER